MANTLPAGPVRTASQRHPAPALFVGPPSHNASTSSLLSPSINGPPATSRNALLRQRSHLARHDTLDHAATPGPNANPGPLGSKSRPQDNSTDRVDALWAEMQNTLEDVELSALSGTHVFGPGHSKALEELRAAQIGLAQAWARSETDEAENGSAGTEEKGEMKAGAAIVSGQEKMGAGLEKTSPAASAAAATREGKNRGRSVSSVSQKSQLEEETENDIALARKRREANDRYFQSVSRGVLEVVAKLEDVAKAMQNVELESKEIWGDADSVEGDVG